MNISEKIGSRLKNIRIELDITQEKLSELSELHTTYISDIENGKRNISMKSLEKIIIGLNITFVSFFDDKIFK
jgi:transcriptional regulator with XRE-family HTH domain